MTHTATLAVPEKSWWPTKKWMAATVTAAGGILVTLSTTDWKFSTAMQGVIITFAVQRIVAYITPNDNTLGGIPVKKT